MVNRVGSTGSNPVQPAIRKENSMKIIITVDVKFANLPKVEQEDMRRDLREAVEDIVDSFGPDKVNIEINQR